MATFQLTNINLQLATPRFNTGSKQLLKVQVDSRSKNSTIIQLKDPAQVLNNQSLQWHQTLTLPANFDKAFPFQIYSKHNHDFGYKPDLMDSVEGDIKISKSDGNYCSWQVTMKGSKAGYLFANIELYSKTGAKKNMKEAQNNSFFGQRMDVSKDNVAITSIYAHFPTLPQMDKARAYLEFELGGSNTRSAIKRLRQREYRSYENIQLKATSHKQSTLYVRAYLFQAPQNNLIKLGAGSTCLTLLNNPQEQEVSFEERVKLDRVYFYNEDSQEVGFVSFKYLLAKDESLDPRFFLQDKFNTIGDVNFRPMRNSSMSMAQAPPSPTLMSPLQTNSRIFMPKASRFEDFSWCRKKNDQIGIAHRSVDLRDFPSTNKYKVSTFGYGAKIGVVQRDADIPGAGRYMLPCVFDSLRR